MNAAGEAARRHQSRKSYVGDQERHDVCVWAPDMATMLALTSACPEFMKAFEDVDTMCQIRQNEIQTFCELFNHTISTSPSKPMRRHFSEENTFLRELEIRGIDGHEAANFVMVYTDLFLLRIQTIHLGLCTYRVSIGSVN